MALRTYYSKLGIFPSKSNLLNITSLKIPDNGGSISLVFHPPDSLQVRGKRPEINPPNKMWVINTRNLRNKQLIMLQ